jgi:hypothetical protein
MPDRDPKTGRFPPRAGKPASGLPAMGEGLHGPAKGAADPARRGRPEGVKNGEGMAAQARAELVAAAKDAARRLVDIAMDGSDPRSLAAAMAILNRVGLHEKTGVEHAGEGGGPIRLTWGDGSTD